MAKNRKIICIISVLIIVVFCSILCLEIDTKTNKHKDNKGLKQNSKNNIAVMVYDEATNNYVKQDNFPTGKYALVKEKSLCVGGSKIGEYDPLKGLISFSFKSADECYLYFKQVALSVSVDESSRTLTANYGINVNYKIIIYESENLSDFDQVEENGYESLTVKEEYEVQNANNIGCDDFGWWINKYYLVRVIVEDTFGNVEEYKYTLSGNLEEYEEDPNYTSCPEYCNATCNDYSSDGICDDYCPSDPDCGSSGGMEPGMYCMPDGCCDTINCSSGMDPDCSGTMMGDGYCDPMNPDPADPDCGGMPPVESSCPPACISDSYCDPNCSSMGYSDPDCVSRCSDMNGVCDYMCTNDPDCDYTQCDTCCDPTMDENCGKRKVEVSTTCWRVD